MDKLDMSTSDLTDENIGKIAKLFPGVLTEKEGDDGETVKAIDFDLLKQELSKDLVEDDNERYRLDWPGKKASLLKANTPITKTLRPDREASVDFDNTKNVYIEGDNFETLKILQESYLGKIKMIYIDPPYNTGKDFVYRDNFRISKDEYEDELGVEDEEGGKLFKNTDTNGRFHSDWLSMMYERLVVARDLLKDDGVIFMSIDDNEVHNLRKIGDEVFGEENFIASVIWSRKRGKDNSAKFFSRNHEYLLVYSKNIQKTNLNRLEMPEETRKAYKNPDNDPRGDYRLLGVWARGSQGGSLYEFKSKDNKIFKERKWLVGKEKMVQLDNDNKLKFNGDKVYRKLFLDEYKGDIPETIWLDASNAANAADEIKNILGTQVFDTVKPIPYLMKMIKCGTKNGDIVLDFFAGSATTAHSLMQLNAEDGGSRKCIAVQIPEKINEKSEAYKVGYKTVSYIGMERIRRAGKKILEENKDKLEKREVPLDIGFRVYKTDTTNMKDVYYNPAELGQESLLDMVDNIKDDRTPEDLLTQVILDLGLTLDLPIETKKIKSNTVFFVADNSLVACFDDNIDFEIVDEIARLSPLKVVFRDSCFKDDKDRINVENRFKRLSPETVISVI